MYWVIFKEVYLERLCTRSPNSDYPAQARRVLDRFTTYCGLVQRTLHQISNLDLELYVQKRTKDLWRGDPLGNRTINNEINLLNTLFSYAGPKQTRGPGRKNLGLIVDPPYIDCLEEEENLPVVLSGERLSNVIAATRFAKSPQVRDCDPQNFWTTAILLGLVSSLRRNGLLRIPRPDDYTLIELRQIVLPAKLSKTRREQRIALGHDRVVEIVASMPTAPGEPLLPWKDSRGRPMTANHFNEVLKNFQKKAGIPETERVRFKHLRSTAATEILDQFGESVAKKKLGHSPHTNTINTNYKGRIVTTKDEEASAHLAEMLLPHVDLKPRLFTGEEIAS